MRPWHHLWSWLTSPWQRARRAERRLAETENATITLRLIIDGQVVAEYAVTAFRLRSEGDWCAPTFAHGDLSTFTIDTDVDVVLHTDGGGTFSFGADSTR